MILQNKKHMFKKRFNYNTKHVKKLPFGNIGLYTLNLIRYELVYLRLLKKIFRQRHIKGKVSFRKAKYWFFLKPNYILTSKSTNARMGAGIGSTIRLTIRLTPYKTFITMRGYSCLWLKKFIKVSRFRYPFKFLVQST